jgi:hypothetical protein
LTSRERNLLLIFLIVIAAAGLMLGLSSYFEGLSRLDNEFLALQKRSVRAAQAALRAGSSDGASSWSNLKDKFYAPGTLPDPLTLASRVEASLKTAGIHVLESRVIENSASAQWIQYHAEGNIDPWFDFLLLLRKEDPRSLFRSMSLVKKQGFSYAISFEVGHVVLP